MNLKVKLKNVKLIKEVEAEFDSGNLYFVRGSNQVGKTTFTNAIKGALTGDIGKNLVTNGEEKGTIEETITGLDGETYKVIINQTAKGSPSFTILYPDLKKSSRKGDLASIFGYEGVTAESFAGWGLTEPGRRKQAELFMKLMPKEVQSQINSIDNQINSKNGELYFSRKELGAKIKYTKESSMPSPSAEQESLAKAYEEWSTDLQKMKDSIVKSSTESMEAQRHNVILKNNTQRLSDEKQKLTEEMNRMNMRLSEIDSEIINLGGEKEVLHTDEDIMNMRNELEASQEAVYEAADAVTYIKSYKEAGKGLIALEEEFNEKDAELEKAREYKKDLIAKNIDSDHLDIEEGQLMFKDDTGSFPINEESLSYSRIAMLVTDLTLKLNPKYPIVCLGKAAEFDKTSIDKLVKYAEFNDAIIILDYVDNTGSLKIECYES